MTALLRHVYQTLDADRMYPYRPCILKDLETRESFLEKHQFVVPEDPVLSMHLLEERYHIEDEPLDAISHGNSARALSPSWRLSGTCALSPARRSALRNRKNLILTLNTLLRRKPVRNGRPPVLYRRRLRQLCAHDRASNPCRRNQRSHILHGSKLLSGSWNSEA